MRLNTYLVESNQKGLGISFFDLDETLFNTYAKINVIKDGKIIKSLSNADFNKYKKNDGEEFDFSEFKSAKLFFDTSKPIDSMIKRAARVIKHTEPKGSKVIILTARADFDDKDLFLTKLRQEGLPVDKTYVERAGNRKAVAGGIPAIKKKIILSYLSDGLYRRCRIFDDFLPTCKEFLTIKNDIGDDVLLKIRERYGLFNQADEDIISFEAYHVQDDGSIKEVK